MKSDSEFYSQNFEDVFLARCFAGITDGFYIDVGAQHEEVDSVTRHFYEAAGLVSTLSQLLNLLRPSSAENAI